MNNSEYMIEQNSMAFSDEIIVDDRKGVLFAFLFIAPLIISSISVAALIGFNYLVIGLGVICICAYLISIIQEGFKFPKEILLFGAFLIWSMTGLFTSTYIPVYLSKFFTLAKFLMFILIISHYSRNRACIGIMFFALLIGAAIVAVSAYISGDYNQAEAFGERVAGVALNSNTFSLTLVYATLALLYFFKTWKSWILKIGVIGILLVIVPLIIASGSRKGFIAFLIVLFLWFFFAYKREILRHPFAVIAAGMAIVLVAGFLYTRLANTTMLERLEEMVEAFQAGGAGAGGGSLSMRQSMIEKGLQIIKNNPLFGIGLDQYIIVSGFEKYSHNNYIEVFASTGILGGIIYYSIFVVLWLRLRRIGKLSLGNKERDFVNVAKTFILMRLVIDLAVVSYYTKINWIILAMFIGFSYHIEQMVRSRLTIYQD